MFTKPTDHTKAVKFQHNNHAYTKSKRKTCMNQIPIMYNNGKHAYMEKLCILFLKEIKTSEHLVLIWLRNLSTCVYVYMMKLYTLTA